MRLLLMGPPGAGKGTQATRVASALGVPSVSTGDIFRANVAAGTDLGKEAQRYMDAGEYVPDQVTNDMVRDRLHQPDARSGWLLDGYPRTLAQVGELDGITAETGHSVDAVVALDVDDDELVRRLARRAMELGRTDDTEDVIQHRQRLYHQETAPLLASYEQRGLLNLVDGRGDLSVVTNRILGALAAASSEESAG
jgi:adenylate kinase